MSLRNIVQMLIKTPSERPTVEDILGHPWLSQGEEWSLTPDVESLPEHLDPAIVVAMCDLGYNPEDICQSLLQRQFDEAMATYLMLREQVCQGITFNDHIKPPVRPEIVPTASPADPSTFALPQGGEPVHLAFLTPSPCPPMTRRQLQVFLELLS
jgi:MAP/microtubule affinity-regulating kinase